MSLERRMHRTIAFLLSFAIHVVAVAVVFWVGIWPGAEPGILVPREVSAPLSAWQHLYEHVWQSTAFAAAIAAATMAFRNNRAGIRYGLWLAASAKFLVPFSFLIFLGSLVPLGPVVEVAEAPTVTFMSAGERPRVIASPGSGTALAPQLPATRVLAGMYAAVGLAWLGGFAAIAVTRIRSWRRIRRAVRAGVPVELSSVALPPRVRLRASASRLEPGVVGFRHPIIVWPVDIEKHLTDSQVAAVLAHELSHIRRHDNLTAALHMLVEAVFWFHPVVWWIGARLVHERERACDEDVLSAFGQPKTYADGILAVCRCYVDSRLACVPGVSGADLKKRIETIMHGETGDAVPRHKRIVLVIAAMLVVIVPIGIGASNAPRLRPQSPATAGTPPAFEVASIKPNKSGSRQSRDAVHPGGRYVATNASLVLLIRMAYERSPASMGLAPFEHEGGPDWIASERFDVNAVAGSDVPVAQVRLMLQALLIERFKLRVHTELREQPLYRLTMARRDGSLGPQLQRTQTDCASIPADPLRGITPGESYPCGYFGPSPRVDLSTGKAYQAFRGLTMDDLAHRLQPYLGRPVTDRTGLSGYFDGDFEFTAEIVMPPPPPGMPNPYDGRVLPSIFSVLPDQLGLRLESGRGPAEILVIDHAERPTEN